MPRKQSGLFSVKTAHHKAEQWFPSLSVCTAVILTGSEGLIKAHMCHSCRTTVSSQQRDNM